MHPILEDKKRLALYLAAWLPIGALLAVLLVLSDRGPWGEALLLAMPLALVYAFLCLAAWFVCRSAPLGSASAPRLMAAHATAALVSGAFWALLGRGWTRLLAYALGLSDAPARYDRDLPLFFTVGVLLFVLASAVHYLLIAFEASRAAQRRALELQVHAQEARLEALKAQINPHFLFNSLNSISALAGSDPAGARRMCLLLAEFLRSGLKLGARERITLGEELALAENFLAIEQVRFGARLRVEKRIEGGAESCLVPPLLIQPLVENAVNHGIAHVVGGGLVRIEARRQGGRLEIAVENPCDADRPASRGQGMGLANVRGRLRALHPRDSRLDVLESPVTYKVSVVMPDIGGGDGHAVGDEGRPTQREREENETSLTLGEPSKEKS